MCHAAVQKKSFVWFSLQTKHFFLCHLKGRRDTCSSEPAANRRCSQPKSLNTKPLTIFTASASFLRAAAFTTCHRSTPSLTSLPGHQFQFQQTTPEYSFLPHLFAPHHLQHIAHGRVDTIAGQPTFQHCACTPQLRRHGFAPGGLHHMLHRKKARMLDFLLCFFYNLLGVSHHFEWAIFRSSQLSLLQSN